MHCFKQVIYFLSLSLFCLVWGTSLFAQETPIRAIEFSCVTWDKIEKEMEFYYRDGLDYRKVEIGYKRRSKLQELSAGHTHLEIYEKVVTPDGEVEFRLIGRGANVAGTSRVLFFVQLARVSPQPTRLGLFGIDDSASAFPVGSFRFLNATNEPLKVLLNKTKGELQPKGLAVVQPEVPELGGFIPVYIGDSQANVVYESRFFAQPRGRKLVVIRSPAQPDGRLRLRFLSEIVPPPLPVE